MIFEENLRFLRETAEKAVQSALPDTDNVLYNAMRYSLYGKGKRVRPVLCLACAQALNAPLYDAATAGSSLEMIHTYSLIHDDLPCMDNDDLRRGKPTNHTVFGEATALLAGDALLNRACEHIVNSSMENKKKLKLLKVLFSASGADGMIYGQIIDMHTQTSKINEDELYLLHKKKTGALINAAAAMGAICADADENIFSEYSASLGIAFQICDDILDVESTTEVFGKTVGSDDKNNKTTFVTLYGLAGAKQKLKEETERAIDALDNFGQEADFLREYALYLLNRKN